MSDIPERTQGRVGYAVDLALTTLLYAAYGAVGSMVAVVLGGAAFLFVHELTRR